MVERARWVMMVLERFLRGEGMVGREGQRNGRRRSGGMVAGGMVGGFE